jgi:hypothetical protein
MNGNGHQDHSNDRNLDSLSFTEAVISESGTAETGGGSIQAELGRGKPPWNIMEPTNDHERVIAHLVDEKFLEDPGNRRQSIVGDTAVSLDFIMSSTDSRFLVRYVEWRRTHALSPANSK